MKKLLLNLSLFLLSFYVFAQQPPGNRGMYFDGVDDQVKSPAINLNNFTIEFWIKTTQTGGTTTFWQNGFGLVDAEDNGGPNDYGVSLGAGRIVAGIGDGNPTPEDFSIASATLVNDGAWHHVAVTRAGNSMQIFIDGNLNASGSATDVVVPVGNVPLTFGSLQTNLNYFKGQLDEIRVFNSVRLVGDIANDMIQDTNNGALGFWRFEEGTGQTVLNSGTNGATNNGTLGSSGAVDVSDPLWALRVTTAAASGVGSLKQALLDANSDTDKDYIDFSITGAPPFVIAPADGDKMDVIIGGTNAAFVITQPAIVDGYSQSGSIPNSLAVGNNANILIEIDGINLGTGTATNGIRISTNNCLITGLAINNIPANTMEDYGTIKMPSGNNNIISGNFIGFAPNGTTKKIRSGFENLGVLINADAGSLVTANILGGFSPQDRNVIAGGFRRGIYIFGGNFTKVYNNYIGTDRTGIAFSNFSQEALGLNGANNCEIGSSVNQIQGRNIIVGGSSENVAFIFGAANNTIQYNFIGVRADETAAPTTIGVGTFSSSGVGNSITGNVILGGSHGIRLLGSQSYTIKKNKIGVKSDGITPLTNTGRGITIENSSAVANIVGGVIGDENIIANSLRGIEIPNTTARNNNLRFNIIYNNTALGIDLGTAGVTANDATPGSEDLDAGANNLQNFPEITSATLSGTDLQITYKVPSATANSVYPLQIDIYEADASTNLQGQRYLGTLTYTSVNALTDVNQTLSGVTGLTVGSSRLVLLATDANGNTSEFSGGVVVGGTASNYYSMGNAVWDTNGNWSTVGATGPDCGCNPNNAGNITVFIGHPVTVPSANNIGTNNSIEVLTGGTLTLQNGNTNAIASLITSSGSTINIDAGTLNLTNPISTTINGILRNASSTGTAIPNSLTFGANGIYIHAKNGGIIPTATWNPTSQCVIEGITSTTITGGFNQTFGNFTWDCSGQTVEQIINQNITVSDMNIDHTGTSRLKISSASNTLTVSQALSIGSTGVLRFGSGNLVVNGQTFIEGLVDDDVNGGSTTFQGKLTVRGNGQITKAGGQNYIFNGDIDVIDNALFNLTGNGTLQFSGLSIQTINHTSNFAPVTPLTFGTSANTNIFIDQNLILTGNKNIRFSGGNNAVVEINNNIIVTNNNIANVIIGCDLNGKNANSEWINADNSFLSFILNKQPVMSIGKLTATANNNTVEYRSTQTPCAGCEAVKATDYFHLTTSSFTRTLVGTTTVNGNFLADGGAGNTLNTLGNTLTVLGNFTNNSNVDFGASTINVRGNFTSNRTINTNTSTVNFNGSNNQTITGVVPFYNLVIDNIAHVNLNNNSTVSNGLSLSNGKLILGTSSLTYTGAEINLSVTNGWIETNMTGVFTRPVSASASLFPIGSAQYTPVTLLNGNNANVSIRFTPSINFMPNPTPTDIALGSWIVNSGTNNVNIRFDNSGSTASTSKIRRFDGTSSWLEEPTTFSSIPSPNYTTINPQGTGTKTYTVFSTPLPTLTISPNVVPDAIVDLAYNQLFTATGGTAPYTFSIVSGSLPAGLTLTSTGDLTGIPSVTGNFNFVLGATDGVLNGTLNITLKVLKATQFVDISTFLAIPNSDNTYTISATASSGLTVEFFSTNENVAKITNSNTLLISDNLAGESDIKAYQKGDNNYNPSDTVVVMRINKYGLVSNLNKDLHKQISIYPNPSHQDFITLSTLNYNLQIYDIQVFDLVHKKLDNKIIKGLQEAKIDCQNLSEGVYFIQIHTNKGLITKPFVRLK
ncbi:hypothetical protein AD998_10040 [bacterium 336/3]|nr:hypothetical protein AD998_10040 [bacterium 336/3]